MCARSRGSGGGHEPSLLQPDRGYHPDCVDLCFDNAQKIAFLGGDQKSVNNYRRSPMRKFAAILAAATALCAFSAVSHAQTVLKASHQFPGGKGEDRKSTRLNSSHLGI